MSWNSLSHSHRLIALFLRSPGILYRTTTTGIINTPLQSFCHSKSHDTNSNNQPSQAGDSDLSEKSDSSRDSNASSKQDSRPNVSAKARVNTSTSNSLHRLLITENDRISNQLTQDIEILDKQREKIEAELRKTEIDVADDDWSVGDDDDVTMGRKGKMVRRTKRYPGSVVSCGGCGVKLQCNDSSIPGYVPEQLYHQQQQAEKLSELLCRRCDTLQKRNKIIHQEVDKQVYSTVIHKMCKSRSLIVMLVDVTDISNGIIHDVLHNIRIYSSVILVGNKIDLIPMDRRDYKARVIRQLENECINKIPGIDRSILHTCLISAKTGYGVERLIDKLLASYFDYPEVYFVGMTNSGKSTLFNLLLDSDYCKYSCRDIVQRATVSKWPGTTLDLIKFPILRPLSHYIAMRQARLNRDRMRDKEEREKRSKSHSSKSRYNAIFETVGKTEFRSEDHLEELEDKRVSYSDHFTTYTAQSLENVDEETERAEFGYWLPRKSLQETDFPTSRWAYDTPGFINQHQVINHLRGEELKKLLKMDMIRPRVFVMKPGDTMFATGLARIDYLKGVGNTLFTVHINHLLPVHVVKTELADQFYTDNIGTEQLGVPLGDETRLDELPGLCGEMFTVYTDDVNTASADIQLSSLGWVSVAAKRATVSVKVYTPGGLGVHLRYPALLPNILAFKGQRINKQKSYSMRKLRNMHYK